MDFVDFLAKNYLWIIIIIIVILMAIVGYIADKTEFIKTSTKIKTKDKKDKKVKEVAELPVVIDEEAIESPQEIETSDEVEETAEPSNISEDENNSNQDEELETIDEALFAPLEDSNEELKPVDISTLDNEVESDEDIWKF